MFTDLSIVEMLLSFFGGVIILVLGFNGGKFLTARRWKRDMKLINKEHHNADISYKKMFDEEQDEISSENVQLKKSNKRLEGVVGEYRSKLAGIGKFSFGSSRKRADIMYALLLENEVLEQLLTDQSKLKPREKSDFLLHKMKDMETRHQLMSKIIDQDETLKRHVMKRLFSDGNLERIEADNKISLVLEAPSKTD